MILVKTEAGQQVLRDRSVRLTPRQRSAFILCDGKRPLDEVLTSGMGIGAEDIEQMIEMGLLEPLGGGEGKPQKALAAHVPPLTPPAAPDPIAVTSSPATSSVADGPEAGVAVARFTETRTPQQRYREAYPIATRLTGSLGLRGFRLNLSVEGTSTYEELAALAPKIRSAVGPEKAAELDRALGS